MPGLEITLDWAQMVYQNAKPEAIRDLLPQTRHVQIRQASPKHLQTPFDKGKIDFAAGDGRSATPAGYDGGGLRRDRQHGRALRHQTVNAVQECVADQGCAAGGAGQATTPKTVGL